MITVIIPYYQRTSGILARAIRSVLNQRGSARASVIVIDDSSPVAANAELASLGSVGDTSIRVIARANGGPAAARNTGLASLRKDTRFVAFLDSDDEWSPEHLQRACAGLRSGHDFYFANHLQLGQLVPAFERAGRLRYADHSLIDASLNLYSYRGDMLDQIIRGNVIGTSTVVFDHSRFPDTHFREEFVSAGEDYLCWMDFALRGARFVYSTEIDATYGHGVNIYSGAEWGTVSHLSRVQNELRYRRATSRLFQVTKDQRAFLDERVQEQRVAFAEDLLQIAQRKNVPPLRICARQFLEDPLTYAYLPRLIARKLFARCVTDRHNK